MKKIFKLLVLAIIINQIVIIYFNNDIKKKTWKAIRIKRLNENDVLTLNKNLNYNFISFNSRK